MEDLVVCIVCGHNVKVSKSTDVSSEGSPVYVGNACLPGYFAWQELQAVRSYVEYEAALFAADIHPIAIPMEDELLHTDYRAFCNDRTCPCHWDMSNDGLNYRQAYVWQYIDLGFLTYLEADRILEGYVL
jgi:hypothetical protein